MSSRLNIEFRGPVTSARPERRTIAVLMDYMTQFVGSYEAQFRNAFDVRCRQLDVNLFFVYGGCLDHSDHSQRGYVSQNSIFRLMNRHTVDGLILLSTSLASFCGPEGLSRFVERYREFPLCSIGLELPGVPSIMIDNRRSMEAVVEHVIVKHGRRHIAFIGGPPNNREAQLRFEAYRATLERHGIEFDPRLVAHGYFVGREGYAAMEEVLAQKLPLDAVIAANDSMALAAARAMNAAGIRVPRDVIVTGFDDLPAASLGIPLTTVAQPFDAMAELAISVVLGQLASTPVPASSELIAEFVVRRSCGCGQRPTEHRLEPELLGEGDVSPGDEAHLASIQKQLATFVRDGSGDGSRTAAQLVEGLSAALAGRPKAFLQVLEAVADQDSDWERCRSLQHCIVWLREHLRRFASAELEDMWHDARDVVEAASTRWQLHHRIKMDDCYARLLQASEQVSRDREQQALKMGLLRTLPILQIQTAFVSRFPEDSSLELEPVACLLDGIPRELSTPRFDASALIPPEFHPDRRHSSLVFPLISEAQQLGVAVFDYSKDVVGHQMLRDQISAGLTSIRLQKEVVERAAQHERSVQERLAAAKHIQSLSVLAGGVAHDLNNALGPLVALPDVILHELGERANGKDTTDLRADIESIKSAALRAAETIKDLLTLGRQGRTTKEPVDLGRVAASCLTGEALRFVREVNPRVEVRFEEASEPLIIRASEAHLARAVNNLVRNAVEAISGSGEVVARVFAASVAEARHGYETVEPGDYAAITVTDTGSGIANEALSRIFEPFFSKKRVGDHSGSGLGLAIVHGVVKEHEGFVDVVSKAGVGTTFTLYFPRAEEDVQTRDRTSVPPSGSAKILIVDDDPVQLRTARRVLTLLGYRVDTLQSGHEARERFEHASLAGKSPYDLVILDMILNEASDGLDLFEQIQLAFPQQKAIVASGHAPTERVELALQKGVAWIAKPYTVDALAHSVKAALSALPNQTVVSLPPRPPSSAPPRHH